MSGIQGVYAAAVTPRRLGTQDINLGAMWELIDYLVEHSVQGIVLLGATGEFVHFSIPERMRLMGVAAKRSRVPVIFNCSHTTSDGVVELAQSAEASGAAAVLVMPPYFFDYTQQQIVAFYRQVAEQAELEIPLLLYNIPRFTSPITSVTASELLRDGVVQGIKDSSGDWSYFETLRTLRSQHEFELLVGSDSITPKARAAGCDGIISGVACGVPELLTALDRGIAAGTREVVTRLEVRLAQFVDAAEKLPTPVAVKEATSLRGLNLGPHSLACDGFLRREVEVFREWFKDWLPVVQGECKHV